MSKAGPFAAFPAKQAMLERLCKMLGLDKPQKVEVSASDKLAAALAAAAAAGRTVDDRDEI